MLVDYIWVPKRCLRPTGPRDLQDQSCNRHVTHSGARAQHHGSRTGPRATPPTFRSTFFRSALSTRTCPTFAGPQDLLAPMTGLSVFTDGGTLGVGAETQVVYLFLWEQMVLCSVRLSDS